jgi:hypothetical protein
MSIFNFMETFFFVSLGITFLLILMLVYHFKQRLNHIEKKGDTMFDIVNNMVKEMGVIKTMCIKNQCQPTQCVPNDPFVLQQLFQYTQEGLANEEGDENVDVVNETEDDQSVSSMGDDSESEQSVCSEEDNDSVSEKVPVSETDENELQLNDLEELPPLIDVSDLDLNEPPSIELVTNVDLATEEVTPKTTEDIFELSASVYTEEAKHDVVDTDIVSVSPSEDNHYRKMLVSDLREIVHSKGIVIEGIQKLKKKELIKLLEDHSL